MKNAICTALGIACLGAILLLLETQVVGGIMMQFHESVNSSEPSR